MVKNKAEWLKAMLWGGITVLSVALMSHHLGFLVSETDSLPYHYFLHLPKVKPHKDDYTVVQSDWYQGKIIKKIVGIEGDKIVVDASHQLFINGLKMGQVFSKGSDDRMLTPIKTQNIPKDTVFLYSNHPKSFDSRYQELGLFPLSRLQGLVIPLG